VKRTVWWLKELFGYRDAVRRVDDAAAHSRVFGPRAAACRQSPCLVSFSARPTACNYATDNGGSYYTDPAHVLHTEGAGGIDDDTYPLCRRHHEEEHRIGRATFIARYGMAPLMEAWDNNWKEAA
jgi:hypothetical protein